MVEMSHDALIAVVISTAALFTLVGVVIGVNMHR